MQARAKAGGARCGRQRAGRLSTRLLRRRQVDQGTLVIGLDPECGSEVHDRLVAAPQIR